MPSEFVNEKLPAEILSKLASFKEFDKFCDVILEGDSGLKAKSEPTSSTSVRAHKLVLAAASPYFRDTLSSGSYMESKEIRIVVDDIDDKTLSLLVDYMYNGSLDIDEKNVWALFGAAKILHLDLVRSECLRYLIEHLSTSNWMETADFAKAHNCAELDDAAVLFARKHFWALVESEELLSMDETTFLHFISDDRLNPKWVKHDSSRQASLPNVLVGVRLPLTSREFLLNRVYNEPMMILIGGGGPDDDSCLADVNIYDPYYKQWTSAAPLLHPRKFFGMTTVGDSVYAVGVTALDGIIFAVGGEYESQTLREAEMLDPRQGEWISLPSMLNGRTDFGLAAVNGLLYAVGGNSGGETLNSMLTDNSWTFLPEMSLPREGLGVVDVDGSLFAFGGTDDDDHLSCIEYLDFDSSRWEMSQACFRSKCH
ncbi:hypothetical protein Q1695_011391 [Nippostrongylus brasiliensis]|nr:hypothetical protein Q1695_011391 [Nippostrongylus brasiliensis]